MGLIIISAIQKYRSGFKPALFFIVAVGLLYIGGIEYSLNTNGIITDNLLFKNIIPNTLVYGIMAEVLIVCLGIVSRYNRFKKESDEVQKQINTKTVKYLKIGRAIGEPKTGISMYLLSINLGETTADAANPGTSELGSPKTLPFNRLVK
jgi:putative Mn2+ efflux pump MntP